MVSGYAHHGLGKDTLELFDKMNEAGVEPGSITFVGVLSSCSHIWFVKEGWHHFESMKNDYGLDATINHNACMVGLIGQAERMDEAEAFINKASFQSKALLWRTMLGAYGKHMNVEAGNRIAEILVKLERDQPSTYVLLSNIYRSASMWEDSMEVRRKMRKGNMNKDPGRCKSQTDGRMAKMDYCGTILGLATKEEKKNRHGSIVIETLSHPE
ncbi:pentatricopeptide repeat-containing protein At3g49170, chloroplastic-like [Magnolia sinica]|uniref:pentatricopeptide repeat-containing protein At3g49170, chloroplastic-like n=1 Tax=Magnolia sinica TaxID=86752 RepID=UPI00265AD75A|nr:pentatricopeptide repeat-containing protein At3g49170, chloroplastic-like [Magnolia sinica]